MFLRDRDDWEQEQRKRAREASQRDAHEGIPGNSECPEVPPFVRACIDECVRRIANALEEHISEAGPYRKEIATSTEQMADADTKIQELKKLLADAPGPTSPPSAKDAFRYEQERFKIERRLEKTQEARDAARAALCGAKEMVNASVHAYRALRVGEEAHARTVIREYYLAVLLRHHLASKALEKSLKPAIDDAFAEELSKLDDAEKYIFNGPQPFGP